ncbi:MAG TPA: crossover junction endodeoxyribonuclease RuvC [Candidatus Paceibacterota bacterium]|nr:crossover junction endodeoxyribonuclease RuvC [Candidatus Paceibacterota bacterium]HRY76869.1 crossover junction endodeoxyribonuclease RuvC [Candidatus Paceibacterota bacterium]
MTKILGIDPGTKRVGYGLIEVNKKGQFQALDFGCLETKLKDEGEILEEIFQKISQLLKKHRPDLMALEKLFFFKNHKTAFQVSQARGVIILAGQNQKIPIFQPTPLEIKVCLTGYGRAEKQQVALMVKNALKLEKIPKLDDTTDALACAIAGHYLRKLKN